MSPDEKRTDQSGSDTVTSTNSSAVGLGPVPATLYLLIPAATLCFIHTQYMLNWWVESVCHRWPRMRQWRNGQSFTQRANFSTVHEDITLYNNSSFFNGLLTNENEYRHLLQPYTEGPPTKPHPWALCSVLSQSHCFRARILNGNYSRKCLFLIYAQHIWLWSSRLKKSITKSVITAHLK